MRKNIIMLLVIIFVLAVSACGNTSNNNTQQTNVPVESEDTSADGYYVGASFNGYEAKNEDYRMEKLKGSENVYAITVELTDENKDPVYNGHFYKITNGTWDADGCWGTDAYILQPAPAHPEGAGLGSVYLENNGIVTIFFNAETKQVADTTCYNGHETLPVIYGDFNTAMNRGEDWSYEDGLVLSDDDFDGIYEGIYDIPAFVETEENSNGYTMLTAITYVYYEEYEVWGVGEQYKFDGSEAGMGDASFYKPEKDTTVHFVYDSNTHRTTLEEE